MLNPGPTAKTDFNTTAICWLVIIGIVGIILFRNTRSYERAADRPLTAVVPQPNVSLEITSRMLLGQLNLASHLRGAPNPDFAAAERKKMLAAIDAAAITPADKLDAIPVIAELTSSESALARLDQLVPGLAPNLPLSADAKALHKIYSDGAESLIPSQRAGLLERHEWFAQLALVFGLPADNPQRKALLHTAVQTTITIGIIAFISLLALVAGVVLLIVGFIMWKKGHLRSSYQPPQLLGPPAFLETFALWIAAWFIISYLLRFSGTHLSILSSEVIGALFSLVVAAWPLLRNVEWSQLRSSLGWQSGRGIVREILAGIIGYIAGLPILAVGLLLTAMLIQKSAAHPTHPILRELGHDATPISLAGIFIAACALAPLIEETMFRGALYSHLRRHHRPILSALIVALLFAAIHPQGWSAIPLLGSIAFILAMLREWRGSLVASITAHALNNALGVIVVLLLLR